MLGGRSSSTLNSRLLVAAAAAAMLLLTMASGAVAQTAPEPAPPLSNDGVTIDQGVAYALLLVALVVTYLSHQLDAFPYKLF